MEEYLEAIRELVIEGHEEMDICEALSKEPFHSTHYNLMRLVVSLIKQGKI